jgi:hypothetical protein
MPPFPNLQPGKVVAYSQLTCPTLEQFQEGLGVYLAHPAAWKGGHLFLAYLPHSAAIPGGSRLQPGKEGAYSQLTCPTLEPFQEGLGVYLPHPAAWKGGHLFLAYLPHSAAIPGGSWLQPGKEGA